MTAAQQKSVDGLLSALESFLDYYDQAGIEPALRDDDLFDADERFNVREGKKAVKRFHRAFRTGEKAVAR
jgi:hypothetical protein